ncbi:MAG TPA: 2-amino-4-hydroxy-6-hydroxymethyldihydropteridine diphosphokinase [Xanthomonadaceae bacterium]|nr:2-amino-4-hydroxy-6-hydroxymethyldihydropteridine diphosphokinase [Xanthomonadaceae bacterium]
MSEHRAFVALGSNLDDPELQVRNGLACLDAISATRLVRASRLYRTPPWGILEQPAFVNAVAELATALAPHDLLAALQGIEDAAGRRRAERWGPRTLDLDLLSYDAERIHDGGLTLPHPQLAERAFVLVPLAELAPDLLLPNARTVVAQLAELDCAGIQALP